MIMQGEFASFMLLLLDGSLIHAEEYFLYWLEMIMISKAKADP